MTVDLELYDRFLALLRHHAIGEARALKSTSLMPALGVTPSDQGRRELRACAQHASRVGHLVCSSNAGYFVPASPEEVLATSARLRSEASELWKRARRADQLAADLFELQDAPEPEIERPVLLALMEA
jgi:hypothetical protein